MACAPSLLVGIPECRLAVRNRRVTNVDVNHSFDILTVHPSTLWPIVSIANNQFESAAFLAGGKSADKQSATRKTLAYNRRAIRGTPPC